MKLTTFNTLTERKNSRSLLEIRLSGKGVVLSSRAVFVVVGMLLSGCSESSKSVTAAELPWSQVARGTSVTITGQSRTVSFSQGGVAATPSALASDATLTVNYNSAEELTSAQLRADGDDKGRWYETHTQSDNNDTDIIYNSGASYNDVYQIANPYNNSYEYQTFGLWNRSLGWASGNFGSFSVGSETPDTTIPTVGTATYTGLVRGVSNEFFWFNSSFTANADFANRTVSFATANTTSYMDFQYTSEETEAVIADDYNFSGNMSYSEGNNNLTGNITSDGGATGTIDARFFGPEAEEIGGNFILEDAGLGITHIGSFGGKR